MTIAESISKQIGNNEKAKEVYQKALEYTDKHQKMMELVTHVNNNLGDKEFVKDILAKAQEEASNTGELIEIGEKVLEILDNKEFAASVIEQAEEVVTNLDEMKKANEAVKKHFEGDDEWIKRVDEKLQKREENQSTYETFQKREEMAITLKTLLELTDDMMAELEDKYYAKKLLRAAEGLLDGEKFNVDNYRKLILSINKYLADNKWVSNILNKLINERVEFFFDLTAVCGIALNDVEDKELGKELAGKYMKKAENDADSGEKASPYDYTNLAAAYFDLLGDKDHAFDLLSKADGAEGDCFAKAYIGCLAGKWGDAERAKSHYRAAADAAETGPKLYQLAKYMLTLGIDKSIVQEYYEAGGQKLSNPACKLVWAQGTIDLFGDKKWAESAYDSIRSSFGSELEKDLYQLNRKLKLEETL
jgi:hypothetical protein